MATNDTANAPAAAVNAALAAAGMSVNALANAAGVPYMTLNRKLKGGGEFKFTELTRIARALDVPPHTLVPSEFRADQAAALAAEGVAR